MENMQQGTDQSNLEHIEVKKAKLTGSLFIEATYKVHNRKENSSKEILEKNDIPVHEDLINAFKNLHRHLPIICDYVKPNKIKDDIFESAQPDHDWVLDFEVTGFSIGGSDDNKGVVLIGNKRLKSGKYVNLVTPFVKFSDDEDHKFGYELSSDIEACIYEIKEYLFNEKRAPKTQLDLFDEEGNEKLLIEADGAKLFVVPPMDKPKKVKKSKTENHETE